MILWTEVGPFPGDRYKGWPLALAKFDMLCYQYYPLLTNAKLEI